MRVLVTGATGFIGSRLSERLSEGGHEIIVLSRSAESARRKLPMISTAYDWSSLEGPPPADAFTGVHAVIHLAGESISGRWTAAKKRVLRESREIGTRNLVAGIGLLQDKPKVLVSVSAIGYYGDGGEEDLNESSKPGETFLAQEVCVPWEAEARKVESHGVRAVQVRNGLVLGKTGGPLPALLTPAKFGVSGPLGSGKQWWSWVHIEDQIGIMLHAIDHDEIRGPLNATAPNAVRQKVFARTLGKVLGRPAFMPAPGFMLRLVLGEFAGELLISAKVLPSIAQQSGYTFQYPQLAEALREILKK